VFDKSARSDETFERSVFTFDHEDDSYICPGGNRLRASNRNFSTPRPLANADGFIRYRAREKDCAACGLKQRCTPKMAARKIMRSLHEGARDMARDIATSDAYLVSRRQRKKVEMLFAHLKRILKLDRLRLRGPNGAKDEFHLAAAAQNLRKLAKMKPIPELAIA
jgi:Transposase DDE domain